MYQASDPALAQLQLLMMSAVTTKHCSIGGLILLLSPRLKQVRYQGVS